MRELCLYVLIFSFGVAGSLAQTEISTCPSLVVTALDTASAFCRDVSSGTLCYGNFDLDAEPQPTTDMIDLNQPGDREDLARILSLRLSAMNEMEETWGIALMDVRATREDSTNTQDVRIVMFGDVAVDNNITTHSVSVISTANLRSGPSTAAAIVGATAQGQELIADGRSADSEWLRVRLPNNPNANAWISVSLVNTTTDFMLLPELNAEDIKTFNAMQAFYFESNKDDAPCEEAPESGLLLQTPEGVAEFTLLLNEVNIQLESTAFVQSAPDDSLTVYALDGDVTIETDGITRVAVPGTKIDVPLDENNVPVGEPSAPQPYDTESVNNVPISLLADQIAISPPMDVGVSEPIAGNWTFSWGIETAMCPGGKTITFATEAPVTSVSYAEDNETLIILLSRYRRISGGSYETVFNDINGNLHRYQLTVLSSDRISGSAEITYLNSDCVLEVPFSMTLYSSP